MHIVTEAIKALPSVITKFVHAIVLAWITLLSYVLVWAKVV